MSQRPPRPVLVECRICHTPVDPSVSPYCHRCVRNATAAAVRAGADVPHNRPPFGADDPMLPATVHRDPMTWRTIAVLAMLVFAFGFPWWVGVVRLVSLLFGSS